MKLPWRLKLMVREVVDEEKSQLKDELERSEVKKKQQRIQERLYEIEAEVVGGKS